MESVRVLVSKQVLGLEQEGESVRVLGSKQVLVLEQEGESMHNQ